MPASGNGPEIHFPVTRFFNRYRKLDNFRVAGMQELCGRRLGIDKASIAWILRCLGTA